MFCLAALCFLLLQTGASGFGINLLISPTGGSVVHEDITEQALLNATVQACRAVALAEGRNFIFPNLNVESVASACEASKSSKSFQNAIQLIQKKNKKVDTYHYDKPRYHFDDETFLEGRRIITEGLSAVKASNKLENYEAAREKLGEILHPLQDFYSHSNWLEMGNKVPNSNLIRSDTSIGNIADQNRATCHSCIEDDCTNNILEEILSQKILTSGYFDYRPFFSSKPEGKCSHGGFLDRTSKMEPTGGIGKDSLDASHGHLHMAAAKMAMAASSLLLDDVRKAAGDRQFLQMMGVSRGKALCFVIDTTGSIRDDIAEVRNTTEKIITSKVGAEDEPSVYILVPFNDPGFGPLIRTTDPVAFQIAINALTATGGGDFPEMSLSGLQLALTGTPPNSEIFVFTDGTAKDDHLKEAVIALIERTKSKVYFMIGDIHGSRRRRQSDDDGGQQGTRMTRTDGQLYRDISRASGGLAIEVSDGELPKATSIISESSSSSQVILLQASRNPGKAENFTFTVDESVKNLKVYITGNAVTFTLISPSGESQDSSTTTGPLVTASQSVGNLKTLQLKSETGLWRIKMVSTNPYILKVVGESPIDFLFDFLEVSQSIFGGFDVMENRPRAGVNGTLIVTVTGIDSVTLTEVVLVESSGSGEVKGSVEALGKGKFLVRFDRIPAEEFVVLVKGQNNNTSSRATTLTFQRQSATSTKTSAVTVTALDSNTILEPGMSLSVPFSVTTSGAGGTFTIQATNEEGFTSTAPPSLTLAAGGSANATVTITAPANTPCGTDVTLTIQATAPGGDVNYVVRRLTVLKTVTDFTKPVCQLLSLQGNCSAACSSEMWKLSVLVSDGTSLDRVSLERGNGTLSTSLSTDDSTLVSYSASCCAPDVELLVVDQVGNVASCSYSARVSTDVASLSTRAAQSFLLCLSITVFGLSFTF